MDWDRRNAVAGGRWQVGGLTHATFSSGVSLPLSFVTNSSCRVNTTQKRPKWSRLQPSPARWQRSSTAAVRARHLALTRVLHLAIASVQFGVNEQGSESALSARRCGTDVWMREDARRSRRSRGARAVTRRRRQLKSVRVHAGDSEMSAPSPRASCQRGKYFVS